VSKPVKTPSKSDKDDIHKDFELLLGKRPPSSKKQIVKDEISSRDSSSEEEYQEE
jgi:hypothetical protein